MNGLVATKKKTPITQKIVGPLYTQKNQETKPLCQGVRLSWINSLEAAAQRIGTDLLERPRLNELRPDLCRRGHGPMYRGRSVQERPQLNQKYPKENDGSFRLQHTGTYTIKQSSNSP
jgi:hypothetical protein